MKSSKVGAVLGGVVVASLLSGCGILKKKQADPAPSATVAAQTAAPVTTPGPTATAAPTAVTEPVVADESIAAPEDFEDEAFEKVSDKTYKAQLDGLKKEIEAK